VVSLFMRFQPADSDIDELYDLTHDPVERTSDAREPDCQPLGGRE
jgi:hypothetical protein